MAMLVITKEQLLSKWKGLVYIAYRHPPSKTPHPKFQCYTKLYSSSGFDFLSPQPQISMLSLGCLLGSGGQKNQTLNLNRVLCNIEIWGVGFYLVAVCGV